MRQSSRRMSPLLVQVSLQVARSVSDSLAWSHWALREVCSEAQLTLQLWACAAHWGFCGCWPGGRTAMVVWVGAAVGWLRWAR